MSHVSYPTAPLVRGMHRSPLPLVEKVFSSLARRIVLSLVQRVLEDLPVQVKEVKSTTFASALMLLSAPSDGKQPHNSDGSSDRGVVAVMRTGPDGIPGYLGFETAFMLRIVQRMLGHTSLDPTIEERLLTDLELRISNRIFQGILTAVQAEGQGAVGPSVLLEDATNGPRFIDEADMGADSVVAVLQFGDALSGFGRVLICLPATMVADMIDQHARAGKQAAPARTQDIRRLQQVEVQVEVACALPSMSVDAVRALAVGEMLFLSASGCQVVANGKPIALADLGESDGRRAVRIVARL